MQTTIRTERRPWRLLLRLLAGIALALALALAIFWVSMTPPLVEFRAMLTLLGATAAISAFAGFLAYQFGWIRWSPRLRWTLAAGYVLSSLLTFLNVWWTARLMFLNPHDLTLATILLVFAGGIAVALGLFLSAAVTDKIAALSRGADAIACRATGGRGRSPPGWTSRSTAARWPARSGPTPDAASMPGKVSLSVGTSGSKVDRVGPPYASARS